MERNWRGRAFLGMSLDGFIARTDDELSWLTELPHDVGHNTTAPESTALIWETFFPEIDALLMGASTYKTVAGFPEWPFPGLTVFVLSTTVDDSDSRITVVHSLREAVEKLNDSGARQIYIDGGQTVQQFLSHRLLDELTVSIAPVMIGSGKSLFADLGRDIKLTVRGSHVTDEGLVRITYDIA